MYCSAILVVDKTLLHAQRSSHRLGMCILRMYGHRAAQEGGGGGGGGVHSRTHIPCAYMYYIILYVRVCGRAVGRSRIYRLGERIFAHVPPARGIVPFCPEPESAHNVRSAYHRRHGRCARTHHTIRRGWWLALLLFHVYLLYFHPLSPANDA